jgi:ATP-dependent RNA helicase DDX23/PRP28
MELDSASGRPSKRPREEREEGEEEDPQGMNGFGPMTPEEQEEARRMADIAARAEARAMARQAEKSNAASSSSSSAPADSNSIPAEANPSDRAAPQKVADTAVPASKFISKKDREQLALERLNKARLETEQRMKEAETSHTRFVTGQTVDEKRREARLQKERDEDDRQRRQKQENKEVKEFDHEIKAIRDHYLGVKEQKRRVVRPSEKFQKIFQFEWEAVDDTGRNDLNPLYNNRVKINSLFGRGYIGGIDLKEQREKSNFLTTLSGKRIAEMQGGDSGSGMSEREMQARAKEMLHKSEVANRSIVHSGKDRMGSHWTDKELGDMSERDWRIFREDFDIRVQGGRATLPLRFWNEANFPDEINKALVDVGYEKPSPIQRQAIPIGLEGRDIIGIAETGSGKTAAFLIPLLCYMLKLPANQIGRCADEGPLAVVMAPTRELALQIEEECKKLCKYTGFDTVCVVGGQAIEEQSYKLRKGVEVVIGTPGRMMDCIENNYLVLNQCNYVVLDEADRMIDMGFEPQVVAVLEAMGGLLKSEDETQLEAEIDNALRGAALYRVTAMFSATMPPEVERIAKTFLRHPAVIKIGDEDTGKNKRIEQRVIFITDAQKKNKLLDELRTLGTKGKALVFINVKKQGDMIGRFLETNNFRCGVLHGGRSQDQREETLDSFKSGEIQVLVATDVAGRGLDIADVTNVVNYDMPAKISSYCHRIGRTGRAGKSGIATSFLTEADTEVMYDLKQYLEATNTAIPQQLLRHPSAQNAIGARDANGKLMGQKKDSIMFAKK